MSAKAAYIRQPVILPNLPPELWLSVFREATHVPFLLHPEQDSDNFHLWGTRKGVQTALARSMKTRRNLVRVCKAWHALASEFLYETLFVRHVHGLEMLAHSAISVYGRYVRRIDVDINDDSRSFHRQDHSFTAIRDDAAVVSTFVHRIAQHTPNLQVAFLHMFSNVSNQIIFACLADACPDLRVVQSANQCINLWNVLFSRCPNLRAIDFLGHLDCREQLKLPRSLKSIVYDRSICPDFSAGRPVIYPVQARLTNLSLLLAYLSTSTIAEFLRGSSFGNVHTLTLLSKGENHGAAYPTCLDELLPVIGEAFPNLRVLSLQLPSWKVFDASLTDWHGLPLPSLLASPIQNTPPQISPLTQNHQHDDHSLKHSLPRSVSEIHLASKQYQAPSSSYTQFLQYFTQVLLRRHETEDDKQTPVAASDAGDVNRDEIPERIVQFVDHRNVKDLMVNHRKVFEQFIPEFIQRKVAVLDHLGARWC